MSWKKPKGRGVDDMSIFQINGQNKEMYEEDSKFANNIINSLISYNLDCPLTQHRRAEIDNYYNDHGLLYAKTTTDTHIRLFCFSNYIVLSKSNDILVTWISKTYSLH